MFGVGTRHATAADRQPSSSSLASGGGEGGGPPTVLVMVMATAIVVVVTSWSISRSVKYSELFQVNPRYQYGLCAVNMSVVILAVVIVCYVHCSRPKSA